MSKINVKKIRNVECYDFETKTNIPYDKVVEVEETKFIKQKLEEKVLEEVEETEGGGKDDNSKGGKGKKKS